MNKSLIKRILTARVYDVAIETPLERARSLSSRLGNDIYLKREDLQPVFSFKLRGAFNKMFLLSPEERAHGVVAASAGNHAQGVALSGAKLGIKTTIVMPVTTPDIKVNAVKAFGGNAVLHGNSYDEAYAYARELEREHHMTFVHPFDDLDVIAGQGTIGMEILRQHSDPIEAVFLCVGGGGLIAGVGSYLKYLYPNIKIIGVEHEEAPTLSTSLAAGERVQLAQVGTFADGAAVKLIGEKTFEIAKNIVDEVLLVSTDETCAAIKDVFEDTRTLLEPAGALAVAGMKKYVAEHKLQGKHLIAIASGANINFDRLRHVAERAELGEGREMLLAVTIPERPGSFREFCHDISNRPITEFNYRYADARDAQVFAGVKIAGKQERATLLGNLQAKGYSVTDLTDNEVAKIHLRYMVGGHSNGAEHEVLYRFTFPERPGALLHFLTSMSAGWNISLFHYRNHGSDFGRVLVGMQVPEQERGEFCEFLEKLGYEYWDETENPAYQRFLG
ncbi:MAG: threonine ammonia-lyase, biosynthetic [Pseudomonadota bacterium]|jgi:threonine dehydratase|uniref:L-threonine dehydratase n=1 Tax=Thiothrix fructosivorans TaxID=111770 RepID=A0A8B0SLU0_9GAMM|nr:threonine ammonia-lyase, biosynthetic [Thiothrix fructosivorans]MBO0613107.1 threonine ammonia-lyase, biosynthetic [Thiothrix fructosivorans]QTX11450.1 threonine ammonia-lyase, biosynthetic [Thiothrix fructosivorans]